MTSQPMRLMIPGPVDSEDEVLAALAEPTRPHYGKEWLAIYNEVVGSLKEVFQTRGDLFLMPGPGTAGLEAALGSMLRTGEKVLVPRNGFFGHRLGTVAEGYGLEVHRVDAPQGQPLEPQAIRAALRQTAGIQALAVVHLETSTGVLNPLPEIVAVARELEVPIIVDAVSSMGGVPLPVDELGIDVCVTVANKCLACPPGLALISVGEGAWRQIEAKADRAHGWYLNLGTWKHYASHWGSWHPYPTTMPTNIIVALRASLRRILAGGLEAHYERHRSAARRVRSVLGRLGFKPLTPEAYTSPLITAFYGLPGMDVEDLRRYLVDEWQILISGGLEDLSGKIWRVGHIGKAASSDYVERLLDGVEAYLRLKGYAVPERDPLP
jgi:alanine-glyoxylate transaminase/serine-glyoxylate transaminase/serine-pyruvate transaminase